MVRWYDGDQRLSVDEMEERLIKCVRKQRDLIFSYHGVLQEMQILMFREIYILLVFGNILT